MAKMPEKTMGLFNDPQAMKMIATVDGEGRPNIAAKGSMMALDDETIVYAEMGGARTKANVEVHKQVAVIVCKEFKAYQVKGEFQGFETSGDTYEQFAKHVKEKLGLDVNNAAIIKVGEVFSGGGKQIA